MNEKEKLLQEIEALIAYGKEEPIINPELLKYMSESNLIAIKKNLLEKVNDLSNEDKAWLEQFRKYD